MSKDDSGIFGLFRHGVEPCDKASNRTAMMHARISPHPEPGFAVENGQVGIHFAGVTKWLEVGESVTLDGVIFVVDAREQLAMERLIVNTVSGQSPVGASKQMGDSLWVSWYREPAGDEPTSVPEGVLRPPMFWTRDAAEALKPTWQVVSECRLKVTVDGASGIVPINSQLSPTTIGNILVWAVPDATTLSELLNQPKEDVGAKFGIAPIDNSGAHIVWCPRPS